MGPGFHTPVLFRAGLVLLASVALTAPPAAAQQQSQVQQQPSVLDEQMLLKLIWSSLAALHHANETGNYSVLRDLAAPGFQANNSAATLAEVFATLRGQRVDLSATLLVAPAFDFPPAVTDAGLLRMRGQFPLRPNAIGFDLLFQNVGGQWRLFGIAVVPLPS